jgi:N-succinyldiaminopimelate aminotransferase
LAGFSTTIFAEMSALAAETSSINLGQGFPDEDGPEQIREAAVRAVRDGKGNQYSHPLGVLELRTAVAEHQLQWYGIAYDPETEVLVTSGATEAIAATLLALLEPGDEVIVLEPYYDSYGAAIAMAGGLRVPVPLRPRDGAYHLDLNEFYDAITVRTRLILLNTPHNPTGTVLTRGELVAISDVAITHDLLVVSDEVYEHLVYEGEHVPIATLPGMRERTLTIGSAGKSFALTGWKIGWVTSTAELIHAVRVVKQFLTYSSAGPFQYAVAQGLGLPNAYFHGLCASLRGKRDLLAAGLADAGLEVYQPAGIYFITSDIRPLGETDGYAFCRALPKRIGVVAIPNSVFYDNRELGATFVRFAFCKQVNTLLVAVDRLQLLKRR